MSSDQEFESVKQNGPTWQPTHTGSKKEKNLKALVANEKSYIIGYYLGSQHNQGPDNNSTIHKLKMTKVGDKSLLNGEVDESGEVSIWGTNVLNDNISKAAPGQLIKIVWEGKKEPKKGGNEYHSWDVLISKSTEPMKVAATAQSSNVAAAAVTESAPASAPSVEKEDDDDLPF